VLAGPREPIEVRPVGAAVVYRFRRPTAPDRARYEREYRLAGGRDWTLVDLLTALDQAVDQLITGDEAGREALHGLIRERIEAIQSVLTRVRSGELPSWGDEFAAIWKDVTTLPQVVNDFADEAARWPTKYAEMLADLGAAPVARGAAAVKALLEAVIHEDGRVERASQAVVDAIPTQHLQVIGAAVHEALYLSDADRKNSPSRSRSPSEDRSSTQSAKA
jgi:hypothetical protein